MRAERWYALALRVLPRHVREADADEMLADFRALWAEPRTAAARVGLWLRLTAAVFGAAAVEWWDLWHHKPRHSGATMRTLIQDLATAARTVRRDPRLMFFSALILGVGLGAATSVFSVMSPLILRPLPVESPEDLVWIANDAPEAGLSGVTSRTSNLMDFREQATSFDGLTGFNAFSDHNPFTLTGDGPPERFAGVRVAHDFLDVLGVAPQIGRNFTVEEGAWGGPGAVILGHGVWTRRFGGDPSVVGRSVTLDGTSYSVVGVLPEHFDFSSIFAPTKNYELLVPFPISPETDGGGNTLIMVGRLRDGVGMDQAQAELTRVVDGLQRAQPDRWGLGAVVTPLQEEIAGPFKGALGLLALASAAVMLIACVNLSNLLLAKAPRRAHEMAIRSALGATPLRMTRQLVFESALLAVLGSAVGLTVAWIATRWVAATNAVSIPLLDAVRVDGQAVAFAGGAALLAGIAIGIVPALHVMRRSEASVLKSVSRSTRSGRGARRLREWLVVVEVALACVLLVFGGLLSRSLLHALDVDMGFESGGTAVWQITPSEEFEAWQGEENLTRATAYFERMANRVGAIPGVASVALSDAAPLGRERSWSVQVVGAEYEPGTEPSATPHIVDHRFLDALSVEVRAGRSIRAYDTQEAEPVAVINQTAARELFRGGNPLGQRLLVGGEWTVVGVVDDVRFRSPEGEPGVEVYLPYAQSGAFSTMDLVVRFDAPMDAVVPRVQEALRTLDPGVPTQDYETLDGRVDRALSPRRFTVTLLGSFAGVALLLAALGIYALLSYSVAERRAEIGIRMTLGETTEGVRRRLVFNTLRLAGIGVLFGGIGALILTRFAQGLLFEVQPGDPLTFAGMVLAVMAVAWAAGFLPALRASRIDPGEALRAS